MLASPSSSTGASISSRHSRSSPLSPSQLPFTSFCMASIVARFTRHFSPSENLPNEPQSTPSRSREMEIFSRTLPLLSTVYPSKRMRMSLPMLPRNSLVTFASAAILVLARNDLNCEKTSACCANAFTCFSSSCFRATAALDWVRYSFKEDFRLVMTVSSEDSFSSLIVFSSTSVAFSAALISSFCPLILRLILLYASSRSEKASSKTFLRMPSSSACMELIDRNVFSLYWFASSCKPMAVRLFFSAS